MSVRFVVVYVCVEASAAWWLAMLGATGGLFRSFAISRIRSLHSAPGCTSSRLAERGENIVGRRRLSC